MEILTLIYTGASHVLFATKMELISKYDTKTYFDKIRISKLKGNNWSRLKHVLNEYI